jgi:hypothetical protein
MLTEEKTNGAIETIRQVGTKHTVIYAGMLLGLGVVFALAAALFGTWAGMQITPYVSAVLFFTFGVKAASIILFNQNETAQTIKDFAYAGIRLIDAEIKVKLALPALPTATNLPTEKPETFQLSDGTESRAVVKEFINGFDPRTLDYMAVYLSNGNPLAENRLEKQPVPYQEKVKWGGLTEGTPLTRLCDLCEAKKITAVRDSVSRKPGKLLIEDKDEIARLLKQEDGKVQTAT